MFAYRHAFHAGNHADVLKHLVLTQVLRHMGDKGKPYTLIDTHAGAGGYALDSRYAQKTAEFVNGIARLWDREDLPEPLADYVNLVREFNGGGGLEQYPGSPAFAQMLMRPDDPLRLYELHPTDERILSSFIGGRPHTKVSLSDGFASIKSELPPPSRRGVVLIDPSYEIKTTYPKTLACVREILERFAEAVILIWIPQLQLVESAQLPQRIGASADSANAPRGWLHARLTVQKATADGFGLVGSSMVVINPPYKLHDTLNSTLPYLVEALAQYDEAHYLLEQRAS